MPQPARTWPARRPTPAHKCRVLLRNFVHLADRAVHLVDSRTLLFRGRHDLTHDISHLAYRLHDVMHRRPSQFNLRRTLSHMPDRLGVSGGANPALNGGARLSKSVNNRGGYGPLLLGDGHQNGSSMSRG